MTSEKKVSDTKINKFSLKATGKEAERFDYVSTRDAAKGTNLVEATSHLIKGCLGAGIVCVHESYKDCGLWTALTLNIFVGIVVGYCTYILVNSAQRLYGRVQARELSYSDVAEACLEAGPWIKLKKYSKAFRYLVDGVIVVDVFGTCCVYQVIIARSIKQLVDGTDSISDGGNPPIRIYILAIMAPCVVLCLIRSLKYLAPFSIVADVFILIVAGATIYYGTKSATVSPLEMPVFKTITGMFEFLGVSVFSVEGVGVALAIENSMANPKNFNFVVSTGMAFVIAIVSVMGFFGYWGYGENAKAPITVNFPWTPFPFTLKVLMAFMIFITFGLNFWVPFNLCWTYIQKYHTPEKFWIWERVYRAVFVMLITIVSIIFPNVSKFIGLHGAFCLTNIGLIFPAFIELSLNWTEPGLGFLRWRLWKAILIIVFGFFICCFGTYTNTKELIYETFINPAD